MPDIRHRVSLRVPLAVSLAGVLVAAGCSDSGKAGKSDPPTAKAGGSSTPTATAAAGFTKEGWFGGADGLHARLQITGVERQGPKSVLKYSLTSLDQAPKSVPIEIALLDPVAGKLYKPTGTTSAAQLAPNTTRQMQAEYPPIPQTVQKLTAITPGTAGEYTGIPVTGIGDAPAAGAATSGGNPAELYDITEGEIKDVTSSGSDVTMNLRTDVLFAFNSAKLSGRAKSVLDEAAQEIKAKADPDKRPLTFDGHTDSKGSDSYNLKLSRQRAEAVMNEMKKRLGDAFKYSAHGKGEAEPVAKEGGKDDAQARARNRRVEISYVVRQQTDGTTGSSTAAANGRGGTVAPAAFHGQDGATVASRYGRFGADKRRLEVKPFYRDGAYIVCVFTITDEGPGTTPPNANYAHKDYPGGAFTSFSVLAQGGKDVYRAVRVGPGDPGKPAVYVDPGRATFLTAVNQPQRGFIYVPAPPGNISSVVFDGGPFGKVLNVPVQ
ncbi:OmpA family protein [Actinomadura sp. LD22]|uniref:OmpA family protein n=1 Tax=Actinomadura physcomitrii TaxID=2650748 RepID=A0A6I4M4A6_9ACTN|nr:OmpA family protein [Actinomadura physcomitrii]MVZ99154.1 OmpA family protein [Actinomadura physcomitrii]